MTQLGETIAVDLLIPEKENCWYCKQGSQGEAKTDENDDLDSIGTEENSLRNSSSKLGTALTHRPNWTIHCAGKTIAVTPSAHHLIPGNACLKKATDLLKFMKKGDTVDGDIGYDVNGAANGVWLPTYPAGGYTTLGEDVTPDEYAKKAMTTASAQYHNAHSDYNEHVNGSLKAIANKMVKTDDKCPICGKKMENAKRPPFGLVGRLNALSKRYKSFLRSPPRKWPTQSGIVTSEKSKLMKK